MKNFNKRTKSFLLGQSFWKWAKRSTCRRCVGLNMRTMSSIAPTFKFKKIISKSQPNLFVANLRDWVTELHQSSSNFQRTPSVKVTHPPTAGSPGRWWSGRQVFLKLLTEPSCSYFQCKSFHVTVLFIFSMKMFSRTRRSDILNVNSIQYLQMESKLFLAQNYLVGGDVVEAIEGVCWSHTKHKN